MIIDNRVGSRELAKFLPGSRLERLEFGDVAFPGNGPQGPVAIGFERKRIYDIISSNRLQHHQLPGMFQAYDHVYIIVEGEWRHGSDGSLQVCRTGGLWSPATLGNRLFTSKYLHNLINSLMLQYGVKVFQTQDIFHTAAVIQHSHDWWNKPWADHSSNQVFPQKTNFPETATFIQRIIKELPGVGWKRAKEVSKKFNTMEKLVDATLEDWASIEGIGKNLAKKIWNAIHGE